jgi:lipoyl-dependent peroxiredoxin
MKLAAELEAAGMVPQELNTTATITLSMEAGGPKITKSQLETVANVPGADKTKFDAAVKAAEQGCPVSRVLNAQVLVSVRLA